ncbi:MAG: hypothetical protein Tsb0014_18600 [Pleurocapsa sp.]
MNSDQQLSGKVRRRRHSAPHSDAYRGVNVEVSLKLVLSWIIAIAALSSLIKLVPYHLSQQAKLKELHLQVEETEARVSQLRNELHHNFDPQQTQSLMEQYSSLLSPNQSRIYWLPKTDDNQEQSLEKN